MENINVITSKDMEALAKKIANNEILNEAAKKEIIKAVNNLDVKRDSYKIGFFFSLLVNGYYTKNLLDAINKDYPDTK